jgi:predicted protein tyrosine phosphatase
VTLVVCPAASLEQVFRERQPLHVLTMASPGQQAAPELPDVRRLSLTFHDVAAPQLTPAACFETRPVAAEEARSAVSKHAPGLTLVPPDRAAIDAVLAFGGLWDGSTPMLVSCFAGISRSTAAAFILACQREPHAAEAEIAHALRRASPIATPNPLMIALADEVLGRQGRMIAAIAAIGRGADYAPYTSFDLPRLASN